MVSVSEFRISEGLMSEQRFIYHYHATRNPPVVAGGFLVSTDSIGTNKL